MKLSYLEKPWCTVALEVGHNEIGDASEPEFVAPAEANAYLQMLGFPPLGPVALMPVHYQIAQKLHGASEPGSNRAHDLIDLQIIAMKDEIDLKQVKRICERLFAYRKQQPWPPVIEKGTNWDELYMKQRGSLDILESPDDAVAWANDFITQINGSY